MNFRELATLQTPPDFQILKYASPAEMVRDFLKAAGGGPTLAIATNKGGSLEEFSLEGASWTLISVFNIKDSKCPLQGAYVLEDDFCYGMRDRDLKTLLSEFPGVRLSPMEDIRTWIDSYENAVVSKVGYFIIDLGLGLGLGRQREKIKRQVRAKVKRQMSVNVCRESACQTLGSTTQNSEIKVEFVGGG